MTDIEIHDGITSIGNSAFLNCIGLTSIIIPQTVSDIDENAFGGCTSLCKLTNHSDLSFAIGSTDNGFIACYAKLIIDKNGNKTYKDDLDFEFIDTPDGFRFMKEADGYKLVSYIGNQDTVTLPININGHAYSIYKMKGVKKVIIPDGVTDIENYAFYECSSLTEMTIPNSVISIGKNAFYNCSCLENVIIPDSVESIGESAFEGCYSLINIRLPNKIKSIEMYTFRYCSALKNVQIPDSVTSINFGAFWGCCSLVNANLPQSISGIADYVFYNCSNLKEISIPDGVRYIGMYSFENCINLNNVVVPNTITQISEHAFYNCTDLTTYHIGEEVSCVGKNAFSGCPKLELTIDADNKEFSLVDGVLYDKEIREILYIPDAIKSIVVPKTVRRLSAFEGNTNIVEVCFEEGSSIAIEQSVFSGCSSLINVVIPYGATYIGDYAFYACKNLASIVIPETVTTIGRYAFGDCSSLVSVIIPKNVTSIEEYLFSGCSSLTSVSIPETITTIGSGSFNGCNSLTSVIIPETVVNIGDYAFSGCGLTSVDVPKNIISIGGGLFSGCSSLTSIVIPDGIMSIGENAFRDCISLVSVIIPETVTTIEEDAFQNCSNLTNITIPSRLTILNDYVFYGCESLTSIEIPCGINSIGAYAFYGCNNLYKIINKSDLTLIIGGAENGYIAYNAKLIIDKNGNAVYKDVEAGFEYIDTVDGFRFVKDSFGYKLLSYLGDSDTVVLPLDINNEQYSIWYMRGVKNVVIPEGITGIGDYAFYGCNSLVSIVMPETVTNIGDCAFRDCNNLNNIELPDSVSRIGGEAFYSTAYYHDSRNWDGEYLYIGKHLIKINAAYSDRIHIRPDTICIADDVFEDCPKSIEISIGGNHWLSLRNVANLETLMFDSLPTEHNIANYFYDTIPLTLKNIVLKNGCKIDRANMFEGVTGVTIYVEDSKENCPWNEVFSGWNNGNKVYYGGEWINAEFRDVDGKVITSDYYTTSQVVRQPYVASIPNGRTKFVFAGWDLDGDGIVDPMPATSGKNISATAVMKEVPNTFTVSYLGFDGETLYKQTYVYGDAIVLPNAPQKKGYVFDGWLGFVDGMTVEADISFESKWTHAGSGHDYDVSAVAPTCDEQGYDKHVCSICDHEWRDNFVDALGHNYGDWTLTTAPTCTDEGLQTRTCLTCGCVETQAVAAVGHDFVITVTKAATCTHEGLANYVCATCGHTEVQAIETIEHSYHKHVVPKSWLRMLLETIANIFFGYEGNDAYYYKCDMCGKVMTSDGVSAMSSSAQSTCIHQPQDWQVTLSPSCQAGLEARICSLCGKAVEVRTTEANGEHVFGDWYVKTAPDCTHTGVERRDCVYCDHFEEKELAVLGHDFVHHNAKVATCTEKGWNEYDTCSRCDYTTYSEIAAKGHTEVVDKAVAPTCTETGLTEGKHCSVCGEVLVAQNVVSALNHDMGEWQQTKAPGCIEVGEERRDCSRCDYFETQKLAALGHNKGNIVEENRIEATCTTEGHYDRVVYCTVCNEELSRTQVTLQKLGHNLVHHDGKAATCTEIGWNEHDTCSRCDYTTYNEIAAKGHTKDNAIEENRVEATCMADGHYDSVVYCTVCNEELSRTQVTLQKLGHNLVHHNGKAATCTEKGWNEYDTCSRCDYTTYEELPAKGHTEVVDKAVAPTCTETGLTEGKHCSVCSEVLVAQNVVAALNHDMGEWQQTKAPGCTEAGEERRYCSRCDHFETRGLAALGHFETDWIVDKEATCTEAGSKHKECSVCHEHLATETIAAHGHEFGEWTTITEPTTKSEGKMIRACKLCGEQEEKTIDKLQENVGWGTIFAIGSGTVATISILAVVMYVIKKKRKLK